MALPMNAAPDPTTDRMARIIRGLCGLNGWEQKDLADATGISPDKLTKSMKGQRRWQVAEIEAIARAFGQPISILFEEPDTLIERVRTGSVSPLTGLPQPPQLELPFQTERELVAVG